MEPQLADLNSREKFFKAGYASKEDSGDLCVLCHSNQTVMIVLAPSHPAAQQNKKVTKVDYKISSNVDRTKSRAVGKSKKGAQNLGSKDVLCRLVCEDGSTYRIFCPLKTRTALLEINESLLERPHLVAEQRESFGYMGIFLIKKTLFPTEMEHLLTEEEYQRHLVAKELTNDRNGEPEGQSPAGEMSCKANSWEGHHQPDATAPDMARSDDDPCVITIQVSAARDDSTP